MLHVWPKAVLLLEVPTRWLVRNLNYQEELVQNGAKKKKKVKKDLFKKNGTIPKKTQKLLTLYSGFTGVMGEYEPKIEVQFPETLPAAKGSTVKLECFALGK